MSGSTSTQAILAVCLLAAYDVGFGFLGVVSGLFVGPEVLLAGTFHLLLGIGLGASAFYYVFWGSRFAVRACAAVVLVHALIEAALAVAAFAVSHSLVATAFPLIWALLSAAAWRGLLIESHEFPKAGRS